MKTQAILFDMDGVILDSEPLHTLARARRFAELGIPADAESKIILGARKDDYWKDFKEQYSLSECTEELINCEFRTILSLIKEKQVPESPYLSDLLQFMTENGIEAAVGSASSREFVTGVLDYLGIRRYFSVLVCGNDVKRPKPSPDTYLLCAERLKAEPARCFVVEDSHTGSLAARAAGIPCIGYRGTQTASASDFSECAYVVTDMREVKKILLEQ